jgi:hypothetical protein
VADQDRYDQSTYLGRVLHFVSMVDPRLIFVDDDELARCRALLADYKANGSAPAGVTDSDLWYAKKGVYVCGKGAGGTEGCPANRVLFHVCRVFVWLQCGTPCCTRPSTKRFL